MNRPRVAVRADFTEWTDARLGDKYEHITPRVSVHVEFDLHDHIRALAVLEDAVNEVRTQIEEAS